MENNGLSLRDAAEVRTAPLVALGLVGGYLTARESGIRPLGGVVLAVVAAANVVASHVVVDRD